MICPNLLDLFGDKCKVTIDRDSAEGPRDKDPWLQQIRCRYGLIYPHSATHLAIRLDHHPVIAMRLVRLGFDLIQNGDDEKVLIFTPDRFQELAAVVQPHRRPQFTEQQIAEATERLAPWIPAKKLSLEERPALPDTKAG
jgi:hypothetical protein